MTLSTTRRHSPNRKRKLLISFFSNADVIIPSPRIHFSWNFNFWSKKKTFQDRNIAFGINSDVLPLRIFKEKRTNYSSARDCWPYCHFRTLHWFLVFEFGSLTVPVTTILKVYERIDTEMGLIREKDFVKTEKSIKHNALNIVFGGRCFRPTFCLWFKRWTSLTQNLLIHRSPYSKQYSRLVTRYERHFS